VKSYFLSPAPFAMALALLTACGRQEGPAAIYAPTTPGTTLLFEAIKLDNGMGPSDRLQLNVVSARQVEDGQEVVCAYSTLQGTAAAKFLCQQDGGVSLVNADGSKKLQLPPGFPDKTTLWQADGFSYQVLGRARADVLGIDLKNQVGVWIEATPDTDHSRPVGAWIEAAPQMPKKTRMLLLPSIGPVETKVQHKGGWVTVNRLVGMDTSTEPM